MGKKNLFFIFVIFCALIVSPGIGAEVRIDDGKIIAFGVDDSLGLSAFNVVLEYDSSTHVDSVEAVDPYILVANIENEKGLTRIAGYSTDFSGNYPKGDIEIASIVVNGTGITEIYVNELVNDQGDPISCANHAYSADDSDGSGSSGPSDSVPSTDTSVTDTGSSSSSGSVDENPEVTLTGTETSVIVPATSDEQPSTTSDVPEVTESIKGTGSQDQPETTVKKSPILALVVIIALFIGCTVYRRFH